MLSFLYLSVKLSYVSGSFIYLIANCILKKYYLIRALVGTGAAGVFAPVNFKERVHAPVLKRVAEL